VHSDAQGDTGANQAMTEARALSTARALVARGVDCKRLLPVGFGETKPVSDNRTADGRAANRRTTLVPAALNGKLIGGMPPTAAAWSLAIRARSQRARAAPVTNRSWWPVTNTSRSCCWRYLR
jgi:hypothetical protein